MAAPTRAQKAVLSKEVNLFVNKGSTGTPNWVMVGCGTSKDYGFSREMATLNCDAGKMKVDTQEEGDFDLQFTGFVFQYSSAEEATNVSAREFEEWGMAVPQIAREYRLAGKYANDVVRTFNAYIATFRETGSNGEARQYNVSLQIVETPVLSDQA